LLVCRTPSRVLIRRRSHETRPRWFRRRLASPTVRGQHPTSAAMVPSAGSKRPSSPRRCRKARPISTCREVIFRERRCSSRRANQMRRWSRVRGRRGPDANVEPRRHGRGWAWVFNLASDGGGPLPRLRELLTGTQHLLARFRVLHQVVRRAILSLRDFKMTALRFFLSVASSLRVGGHFAFMGLGFRSDSGAVIRGCCPLGRLESNLPLRQDSRKAPRQRLRAFRASGQCLVQQACRTPLRPSTRPAGPVCGQLCARPSGAAIRPPWHRPTRPERPRR
jgi:hypothetical protein